MTLDEMRTLINKDAVLQSLLYDLDLMPEQLDEQSAEWNRMRCICAHWKVRFEMTAPATQPTG